MRAAWYETQGPAREVLKIGEMADPTPGPGEVRIRMVASGINPGDVKKRQNAFGYGMPYTRVIPHSDGSGEVDLVGEGVSTEWIGQRSGATARSRTGRSAWLPNTPSYPSKRLFRSRKACPSNRAPVLGFPASRRTVMCTRRVRLRGVPSWCKAGPVR